MLLEIETAMTIRVQGEPDATYGEFLTLGQELVASEEFARAAGMMVDRMYRRLAQLGLITDAVATSIGEPAWDIVAVAQGGRDVRIAAVVEAICAEVPHAE